ncbi:hypothetical protein [Mesoplasma coleopterae]|uniref:hypothetical protein n=1 Tax=Mesoplasma coleopterae TaxID=324078 RepID=UPI000C2834B3|nr:hypothetical protein [Mesoplasma coleopterae]
MIVIAKEKPKVSSPDQNPIICANKKNQQIKSIIKNDIIQALKSFFFSSNFFNLIIVGKYKNKDIHKTKIKGIYQYIFSRLIIWKININNSEIIGNWNLYHSNLYLMQNSFI